MLSPLVDAELNKAEVRALSRELGLPNWDKPALACLSSRVPFGTRITLEALTQVDRAESYLRHLGTRRRGVGRPQSVNGTAKRQTSVRHKARE